MSEVFPDTESACRTFLRNNNVANQRVFFGVPKENPIYPLVTVRRAGGGDDSSDAPLEIAVIQFSCWGRTKDEASQTVGQVRTALSSIRGEVTVGSTIIYGATVDIITWAPDPADDRPRYIVTTSVTARAA